MSVSVSVGVSVSMSVSVSVGVSVSTSVSVSVGVSVSTSVGVSVGVSQDALCLHTPRDSVSCAKPCTRLRRCGGTSPKVGSAVRGGEGWCEGEVGLNDGPFLSCLCR